MYDLHFRIYSYLHGKYNLTTYGMRLMSYPRSQKTTEYALKGHHSEKDK